MSEPQDVDPALEAQIRADAEGFKDRMKYIGLQINLLPKNEKSKFDSEFKGIGKSLSLLRRSLLAKRREQEAWYTTAYDNWLVGLCALAVLLLFG